MKKTLRSDTLKIIAMILMVIDHIGIMFIEPLCTDVAYGATSVVMSGIYSFIRAVGRIAFPIFCYQLVKGFAYTSNRIRYIGNLFVFALISEIPFDISDSGELFDFRYQNVIFTLLIGALMMYAIEQVRKPVVWILIILVASGTGLLIRSDYGARGIILIAILYFLQNDKSRLIRLGPALFVADIFFVTLITSGSMNYTIQYCQFEIYGILAFYLMYLDNGIRRGGKILKWIGYWSYPAHFLILYFILNH